MMKKIISTVILLSILLCSCNSNQTAENGDQLVTINQDYEVKIAASFPLSDMEEGSEITTIDSIACYSEIPAGPIELAEESIAVVLVTAQSVNSLIQEVGLVFNQTEYRIDQTLKGDLQPSEIIVVAEDGGIIPYEAYIEVLQKRDPTITLNPEEIGSWYKFTTDGAPLPEENRQYILFLRSLEDGVYNIVGGYFGRYEKTVVGDFVRYEPEPYFYKNFTNQAEVYEIDEREPNVSPNPSFTLEEIEAMIS